VGVVEVKKRHARVALLRGDGPDVDPDGVVVTVDFPFEFGGRRKGKEEPTDVQAAVVCDIDGDGRRILVDSQGFSTPRKTTVSPLAVVAESPTAALLVC